LLGCNNIIPAYGVEETERKEKKELTLLLSNITSAADSRSFKGEKPER
jgi:hypothetical protein